MLMRIYNKLFKSKFAKNIVLVAGGTAFAQLIGVVFSPIITRIYLPEEYGILTVYASVLALISISASLDYQQAIPIADDDEKAINLLALSTIVLTFFVAFTVLLFIFLGDEILGILDSQTLLNYKYLIPVGVFFTGGYNILLQWTFRMRNYKAITKTKINQSVSSNLLKVILGIFHIGPLGLVLGTVVGQSAGITTLTIPIFTEKSLVKKINIKDMRKLAKRYIKFPLYSAPSNYVYTAGSQLPFIFLTSLFGNNVIGLFGLANSIVNMPMDLIGTSISQVFYAEAANIGKSDPEKLKKLSLQLMKKLALVGLIPVIVLFLCGPELFSFVFGPKWYEAGIYAQIISVMIYFHFIILPVGRILEIFERQKEGLILNIFRLVLIFSVFGVAKFMKMNSYQTIILYTISNSFTYVLLFIVVLRIMNSEIKDIHRR